MILYDELYFEITAMGQKCHLEKIMNYLESGEMDDFFEFSDEYIYPDDNFDSTEPNKETKITISSEDYGIEIDELDTDEFLELLCKVGKWAYIKGQLSDSDGNEYSFVSEEGNSYYVNARSLGYNEDEDKAEDEE